MATKREGEPAYDKADLDEPIFTLRAQDMLAPIVIEHWCDLAERAGSPVDKVAEGRACVVHMREWQRAHDDRVKVPD